MRLRLRRRIDPARVSWLVATAASILIAGNVSAQAPAAPPQPPSSAPFHIGTLVQSDLVVAPDYASFELPNARLRFSGRLTPETRLFSQINLSRSSEVLLDARINHALSERFDLEGGVYMVPFSRELLTFPGYLPLSNRSRVVRELAPFWQVGAGFNYQIVPRAMNARAGIFNGNGGIIRSNDNNSFLYVGRIEGVSRSAVSRFDIGASFAFSRDEQLAPVAAGPGRKLLLGADVVWDIPRAYVIAEMIYSSFTPDEGEDVNPLGAFGRLGYRATPAQSLILGIDFYDPDHAVTDHNDVLLALAYSHYLDAHLRFLLEYTFALDAIDTGRFLVRMQVARL